MAGLLGTIRSWRALGGVISLAVLSSGVFAADNYIHTPVVWDFNGAYYGTSPGPGWTDNVAHISCAPDPIHLESKGLVVNYKCTNPDGSTYYSGTQSVSSCNEGPLAGQGWLFDDVALNCKKLGAPTPTPSPSVCSTYKGNITARSFVPVPEVTYNGGMGWINDKEAFKSDAYSGFRRDFGGCVAVINQCDTNGGSVQFSMGGQLQGVGMRCTMAFTGEDWTGDPVDVSKNQPDPATLTPKTSPAQPSDCPSDSHYVTMGTGSNMIGGCVKNEYPPSAPTPTPDPVNPTPTPAPTATPTPIPNTNVNSDTPGTDTSHSLPDKPGLCISGCSSKPADPNAPNVTPAPTGNPTGTPTPVPDSWGGSCGSGFQCSGDAIQCAIAQDQYKQHCEMQDTSSDLYKTGAAGMVSPTPAPRDSYDMTSSLDTSDAIGGGSCPAPKTVQVMGQTISIPYDALCTTAGVIGWFVVALSLFGAVKILAS